MAGTNTRSMSLFALADSIELETRSYDKDRWSLSGSFSFRGGSATLRCSEMALATPRNTHELSAMRMSVRTLSEASFIHHPRAVRAIHCSEPAPIVLKKQRLKPAEVLYLGRTRPVPRNLLLDHRPL